MTRADNRESASPPAAERRLRRCGARRSTAVGAVLLVAITALAYLPALRGDFIWDDQEYLVENPVLHEPGGLRQIWTDPSAGREHHYWPMTYTTFWLESQCWGLRPFGYHLTNVLLHVLNSLLVWVLLHRLRVPGAWLAAAVFALHPVHVESVAWIIERKDVLSGCFSLLALLAYLRFDRTGRWTAYALALGLFVGAVLSKSMAISLPVVIAVGLWWKRERFRFKDLVPLAPFVGVAAALALADVRFVREAETVAIGLSPVDKALIAGRALWFYAAKLCWPTQLTAIYPRWQVDGASVWAWLHPAAALALAVALWTARRRTGRGPLAAVLFFAVTLGPVLGFVEFTFMRYAFVADRFQYFAALGPIALAAAAVTRGARTLHPSGAWTPKIAAGALLVALGALTWNQSSLYRDSETFWRANVRRNPQAWAAHYNLGVALAQTGWPPEEVIGHLTTALTINPDCAEAHNRLGMENARRDDFSAALWHFGEALRIDPGFADADDNLTRAHFQWALKLADRGQLDAAIDHFQHALRRRPDWVDVRYNLGLALAERGRLGEAIVHLDELLRLAPGDAQARALRDRLSAAQAAPPAEPLTLPDE